MIAGFASVLGKQARGTVLFEATQQTKPLTPQQHLMQADLLLAHRQHRQGAPPGTPEPGGVSPLSCRGVSSLYCAYSAGADNRDYGWFEVMQRLDVTAHDYLDLFTLKCMPYCLGVRLLESVSKEENYFRLPTHATLVHGI